MSGTHRVDMVVTSPVKHENASISTLIHMNRGQVAAREVVDQQGEAHRVSRGCCRKMLSKCQGAASSLRSSKVI